jgi:hypothetical protein
MENVINLNPIKPPVLISMPWLEEIPNTLIYIATYGLSEMLVRTYMRGRPRVEIIYHLLLLVLYYHAHIALVNYKQQYEAHTVGM